MKVLVVSQYFMPENFRINDLTRSLIEHGHHVSVLTGIPNYPEGSYYKGYGLFRKKTEELNGARVYRVPVVPRGKGGSFRLSLNFLSFAIFASIYSPFVFREKYDVIFVFAPSPITVAIPALVLKFLKKIPLLLWVQDLWPESLSATGAIQNRAIIRGVRSVVRFIYKQSDRVLVASKAFFPSVIENQANPATLHYFPQSAEVLYRPLVLEDNGDERKLVPDGFCVMFAGNIGVAQSFETIIAAAEILKSNVNIKFAIIGDGRMRKWVENEIVVRGLEKTVYLLGRHPIESMPKFFSFADVLLVSLKKDPIFSLTIPGKLQSYLACGRPVIAALDGEGGRIVTEAKAGLVCPAEDHNELANVVSKMYEMTSEEREEMGSSGLAYCHKYFNRERLVDNLEEWMFDCIDEKSSVDC